MLYVCANGKMDIGFNIRKWRWKSMRKFWRRRRKLCKPQRLRKGKLTPKCLSLCNSSPARRPTMRKSSSSWSESELFYLFIGCLDNNRAKIWSLSFLLFQGSDKDKRKDAAEKEEKAKKVLVSLPSHVLIRKSFGFKHLRTEFYALFCVWFL